MVQEKKGTLIAPNGQQDEPDEFQDTSNGKEDPQGSCGCYGLRSLSRQTSSTFARH